MIASATGAAMANAPKKPDNGTKKESDQANGLAKSFDQYEYVAVITPGAALLLGLLLTFPGILPGKSDSDIGLGALGIFLVAAYVAGQILRAIGDVAEKKLWRYVGGMPTEWILRPDLAERIKQLRWHKWLPDIGSLLDKQQEHDLKARVDKLFNVKFDEFVVTDDDASKREKKFDDWQAITRRIYTTVLAAKKNARVDAFNRTYGMMVGITVALAITSAALWVQALVTDDLKRALLGVLAFIVANFTMYRAFVFGKLYARELYVSFLAATKT